VSVTDIDDTQASPLVGEVGGGRQASAGHGSLLSAVPSAKADEAAPPPNPPHEGDGLKRLSLAPDAIHRARGLRKRMTKAERVLWRALRGALPGWHWRKQVPLGPYFADFASHSAKLIIELDGGQHAAATGYDAERTRFLESEGFQLIRFWNNDVLSNTDGVLQRIAEALSQIKASPLVGEVRGGLAASAGDMTRLRAEQAIACSAPPPHPPHKGEGPEIPRDVAR
jgi:very-short-patch-repair endonuclease